MSRLKSRAQVTSLLAGVSIAIAIASALWIGAPSVSAQPQPGGDTRPNSQGLDDVSGDGTVIPGGEDDEECTLRAAIELANLREGNDDIGFAGHQRPHNSPRFIEVNSEADLELLSQLGNVDLWRCTTGRIGRELVSHVTKIEVRNEELGPLPAITDLSGTRVMANAARIGNAHPGVQITPINPELAKSAKHDGFTIRGNHTYIVGFIVHRWFAGIDVGGSFNTVDGNNLGTDRNGATLDHSNVYGLWINAGTNTTLGGTFIKGTLTPHGNWISGNDFDGIRIIGGDKTGFFKNRIGLDATGHGANPNGRVGIFADTGAGTFQRTFVDDVIFVCPPGSEDCRTVVSGNRSYGVLIKGPGKEGSIVDYMYIGTDIDGRSAVPNGRDGIYVVSASGIQLNRLVVSGNVRSGISFAGAGTADNWVHGNHIGTSANGQQRIPNKHYGIRLADASDHDIGLRQSEQPGTRNTIAGNTLGGIAVIRGSGHKIYGNHIGWSGNQILANGRSGVLLTGAASNIRVGAGSTRNHPDEDNVYGNLIVGNSYDGVRILRPASKNHVAGNVIRDNGRTGVTITGPQNTIGTNGDATFDNTEGNEIYGNPGYGVWMSGSTASENRIAGNEIGRDGSAQYYGVAIQSGAHHNLVGTDGDAVSDHHEGNDISNNTGMGVFIQDSAPQLDVGVISGVTNHEWTRVTLKQDYDHMVVVTTPNFDQATAPMVTRVRVVGPSSFEVKTQRTDGSDAPVAGIPVHFIVMEEGHYDGFEARRVSSTVTNYRNSWTGQSQTYLGTYTEPVVVGQVMSFNDEHWSVFWASGESRFDPPSASYLQIGKHVGADPDRERAEETIGYIVFEAGMGTAGGRTWGAAVSGRTLTNRSRFVSPLEQIPNAQGQLLETSVAIASTATMRDGDGGWVVLPERHPVSKESLGLVMRHDGHIAPPYSISAFDLSSYVVFSDETPDNRVSGNRIADNTRWGVLVVGGGRNYIGTHDFVGEPARNPEGNRIVDNGYSGVKLESTGNTVVRGNVVASNTRSGILVGRSASDVQIGVGKIASPIADGSMGNEILENERHGIHVWGSSNGGNHGTSISGNEMTPSSGGSYSRRNGWDGIHVSNYSSTVVVGGHGALFNRANLDPLTNLLSGGSNGIEINGSRVGDLIVQTNIIRDSGRSGVRLTNTSRALVGTHYRLADDQEQNFIYGNGFDFTSTARDATGVYLVGADSFANKVNGNQIGSDENGEHRNNRNGGVVVAVGDNSHSEIRSNTIAPGEDTAGIRIYSGTKNSLLTNDFRIEISDAPLEQANLIHLGTGSVPNDQGDSDNGANDLQNHPIVRSVELTGDTYTVHGTLHSRRDIDYRVELYIEQDGTRSYLGATEPERTNRNVNNPTPNFSFEFPADVVHAPSRVYATATEILYSDAIFPTPRFGSTSEFGAGVDLDADGGGPGGPSFASHRGG